MEQELGIAMSIRVLLFVLCLGAASACGQGNFETRPGQPREPLLAHLKPPPVNLPVVRTPIPTETIHLPSGDESALLALSGGRRLRGARTFSGRLTVRRGRIQCTGADGVPVDILYRLPKGLPEPPELNVNGRITVVERSSVGGPDRLVLVRRDQSLLLAQIWLKSQEPLAVDLGTGLRISQQRASGSARGQLLVGTQVDVFHQDQPVARIPVAEPTRIQTPSGIFQVVLERSHLAYSSGPTEQHHGGYILEAWVVRTEQ